MERLIELEQRHQMFRRRQCLLVQIERAAPNWAAAIRNRAAPHHEGRLPGDASAAWRWRQFFEELERRSQTSLEGLQQRCAQLEDELRRITVRLVEKKTWAAQARRTTPTQRRALEGWRLTTRKIGKGTGKRVPRLMAEARRLMPECQTAVPVWIMPLSRVADNFDPRRNRFDVVIIDEASQADMMALTALYLGRRVMVVGDDEQVSPLAVGQRLDEVQKLIDEHLNGIPNSHLFDGQFSVYDLARTNFEPIVLREHFRCVPPIIQFSNHLSYHGKIKPLRDASDVTRLPPTIAYRVEQIEHHDVPRVNKQEASVIVSLLLASCEQVEYADATFGIISLVGDREGDQIAEIQKLLQQHVPPTELERRRILCGNAAHFQGDERDVIFLSLVAVPKDTGPLPLQREGAGEGFKKRLNVAASRARDQMWVVHSIDPETDLQPADLRRRLILHARQPEALTDQLLVREAATDSEFERQVLRRLMAAGYRVTPQWQVGAYHIDLVVEGGGKRLAVECDGDRYHTLDNLPEDMARQAILERLGWHFVRIRGSEFFREPERAMAPIFARLEQLEITPDGPEPAQLGAATTDELKERVIRRAAELRHLWLGGQADDLATHDDAGLSDLEHGRAIAVQEAQHASPVAQSAPSFQQVLSPDKKPAAQAHADGRSRPQTVSVSLDRGPDEAMPSIPSPRQRDEGVESFEVVTFLRKRGLRYVDFRHKRGALWIIGGKTELKPVMDELRSKGFAFTFSPNGGGATNYKPAWFCK